MDALRLKIDRFRRLLAENNRVLDLLAEAEEKLGGDFIFDTQYIRFIIGELESAVDKIVRNINLIAGNRYPQLSMFVISETTK